MSTQTAVIAFSGGLDTSFLVPFAREKYGFKKIITCTVDTGGFSELEKEKIAARSKEVGADSHVLLEAEQEFYDLVLKFMIYGNVSRDGYPLCVGTERLIQGMNALKECKKHGSNVLFHGSTGAGNDQYRFDLAVYVLGKGSIHPIAPIREFNISREFSTKFLKEKGVSIPERNTKYSYNVGLWGVTIGGTETHSSTGLIPDEAWYSQPDLAAASEKITLDFLKGEVSALYLSDGKKITGSVSIIRELSRIGNRYSIGRHYHIGTSIPGKKGRVAYESPAADIIYESHRTLEKITLTQSQIMGKKLVSDEYGRLMHEARFFDPYLKDLEAYLISSQKRVTGKVEVTLVPGFIKSSVADSPFNLLAAKGATYGEVSEAYTGLDAAGACKLHGFEQRIYHSFDDKSS